METCATEMDIIIIIIIISVIVSEVVLATAHDHLALWKPSYKVPQEGKVVAVDTEEEVGRQHRPATF